MRQDKLDSCKRRAKKVYDPCALKSQVIERILRLLSYNIFYETL